MVKKVKQFRFFGDNYTGFNTLNDGGITSQLDVNEPEYLTSNNLIAGNIFEGYYPILQLGIQTIPGLKFYLNGNQDPVFVGASGIYELDLIDSSTAITKIKFDVETLRLVNSNPNGYLIIDIIYQED